QRRLRLRLAEARRTHDRFAIERMTGDSRVVALQAAAGHPGFETAAQPAPARRSLDLLVRRPRQWNVPPLSADTVRTFDELTVDDQTAAASRAENHGTGHFGTGGSAVYGFGQCKTVRVVREPNLASERRAHVSVEIPTIEPDRVRVTHRARARRDRTGRTDADRAASTGLLLDLRDQVTDGAQRTVIVARIRRAYAREKLSFGVERGRLDLRPAEIHSHSNRAQALLRCRGGLCRALRIHVRIQ